MSSYMDRLLADHDMLAATLRAAGAPAHPEELAGEGAARAAFLSPARLGLVPEPPRRPSMLKSALAKVLTVKALVVVALAGSTGVVLATGSGTLPGPWSDTPATPPATSRPATPTAPPSVTPTERPSNPADAGAAPSPSMPGLCQSYETREREHPGKSLDDNAFTALVTAAGGRDRVPTYCHGLTDGHPTSKPSDRPSDPDNGDSSAPHPTSPNRQQTPASPARAATPGGADTPTQGD